MNYQCSSCKGVFSAYEAASQCCDAVVGLTDEITDDQAQQEIADYDAHIYELEQAHYRQLEGEEREREEAYANE